MTVKDLFKEVVADGTLRLKVFTTKPTTGLAKGELIMLFHNDYPNLAVCANGTSQLLYHVVLKDTTLGRHSW